MSEENADLPTRSFMLLGKRWVLQIDRYVRRDVKAETNDRVDLFAAFDPKLYEHLADPETLIDVLWGMCKTQYDGVTAEQFGRAFRGNVIDEAAQQLEGAILDFFPDRQRRMLTQAKEKGAAKVNLIEQVINKAIDAEDPEVTSMMTYLNSPASPETIPAVSPSAS